MPHSSLGDSIFHFEDYDLDLRRGELRKEGRRVRLQPQPLKLLELLVRRGDALVTREELREQLWDPGTFVDFDQGLNYGIRQLRAALRDNVERPKFIVTVPKRGYRFIAAVTVVSAPGELTSQGQVHGASWLADADGTRWPTSAVPTPSGTQAEIPASQAVSAPLSPRRRRQLVPRLAAIMRLRSARVAAGAIVLALALLALALSHRSPQPLPASGRIMLAVLPFHNLTGDPQREFVADGMTEEMITQLCRLDSGRLGVIAGQSAMLYQYGGPPIGALSKELGVSYIVEGSVRQDTGRIRVTVKLISALDQAHLWAGSYDGDIGGDHLLGAQRDIANQIAASLFSQLLAGNRPKKKLPICHPTRRA